ncbi:MAG: mandelate racemase/muconate lactonizing enzyme family protein [Azospirillaceae bacterium]
MRIVALETLYHRSRPNVVYLRLETDDGIVGLGETFYGGEAVAAYAHEAIAPLLLGVDPLCRQAINHTLLPYVGRRSAGVEMRGVSAVDMALWDIAGQASSQSLVTMLGGAARDRVPAYNTCAGDDYVRATQRVDASNWGLQAGGRYDDLRGFLERPGELAASLVEDGFHGMKVWPFDQAAREGNGQDISRGALKAGCGILAAIREAVGDRIELLLEMHGLWSLPAACRIAEAAAEFRPYWFEDPIQPDNARALASFRQHAPSWTAASEMLTGVPAYLEFMAAGAMDVAIVDIGWCGGLTEAVKIAALAEAHAIPITPHDCTGPVQLCVAVAFSATQRNALAQEMVRAFYRGWYADFVTDLPPFEDGHLTPLSGPGLGTALSEQFLADPQVVRRRSCLQR